MAVLVSETASESASFFEPLPPELQLERNNEIKIDNVKILLVIRKNLFILEVFFKFSVITAKLVNIFIYKNGVFPRMVCLIK